MLLLLAAMQLWATGPQLGAYEECLLRRSETLISGGSSLAQFRDRLRVSCQVEQKILRAEMIRRQMDEGVSQAEAQKSAAAYLDELLTVMEDLLPVNRR